MWIRWMIVTSFLCVYGTYWGYKYHITRPWKMCLSQSTCQRPISFTTHAPPRYRPNRGPANSTWVRGSVEGVRTAAATTAPTTTYLQMDSIWSPDTKPVCPSRSCITGTCKWISMNKSNQRYCLLLLIKKKCCRNQTRQSNKVIKWPRRNQCRQKQQKQTPIIFSFVL